MRYAHVIEQQVVNTIEWDGEAEYMPPGGGELITLEGIEQPVGPGWQYIGGEFVQPLQEEQE